MENLAENWKSNFDHIKMLHVFYFRCLLWQYLAVVTSPTCCFLLRISLGTNLTIKLILTNTFKGYMWSERIDISCRNFNNNVPITPELSKSWHWKTSVAGHIVTNNPAPHRGEWRPCQLAPSLHRHCASFPPSLPSSLSVTERSKH